MTYPFTVRIRHAFIFSKKFKVLYQYNIFIYHTLLISRKQIDSKNGVHKKGTERLLFSSKFYSFFYRLQFSEQFSLLKWSCFYYFKAGFHCCVFLYVRENTHVNIFPLRRISVNVLRHVLRMVMQEVAGSLKNQDGHQHSYNGICLLLYFRNKLKRINKYKKRWWVREIIRRRDQLGKCNRLTMGMWLSDHE
jgi:hypothetical protein